jgi:Outer membrane protein beta-barrel domain
MRRMTVLTVLLFSPAAWTQDRLSVEGPYLGLAAGILDWDEGFSIGTFTDSGPIVKLYGGFRFNERWAVEGSFSRSSTLEDVFIFPGEPPTRADFDIFEVRGLAHVSSFVAGVGFWDMTSSSSPPIYYALPRSDSGFSAVVGGQWSFKERWSFGLEYERFDTEGGRDVTVSSFGAHYGFGKR